jgi:hypothetical protein
MIKFLIIALVFLVIGIRVGKLLGYRPTTIQDRFKDFTGRR